MFVVGLGEPNEKMFLRSDNKAAIRYAKETKLRLLQVHSTQLCYEAVAEMFGES